MVLKQALWKSNALMHSATKNEDDGSAWDELLEACRNSVHESDASACIPGAGRGLFASKPLEAGQIISFYPIHAFGIQLDGGPEDGSSQMIMQSLDKNDQSYFQSEEGSKGIYRLSLPMDYQILASDLELMTTSVFGQAPWLVVDINPNRPLVSGWMAHLINDGAKLKENSQQSILEYYEASLERHNCRLIPWGPTPMAAAVTTKPIDKGQELFTCYQDTYWLTTSLGIQNPTIPSPTTFSWQTLLGGNGNADADIQQHVDWLSNDLDKASAGAKAKYQAELDSLQSTWNDLAAPGTSEKQYTQKEDVAARIKTRLSRFY